MQQRLSALVRSQLALSHTPSGSGRMFRNSSIEIRIWLGRGIIGTFVVVAVCAIGAHQLWTRYNSLEPTTTKSAEHSEPNLVPEQAIQTPKSAVPGATPLQRPSDWRQLGEWQKALMVARLCKYPGQRVRIIKGPGPEITAYSQDFQDVFKRSKWTLLKSESIPDDRPLVDVQFSMSQKYWGTAPPDSYTALRSEFLTLGIKCYIENCGYSADTKIPPNDIVVMIGPPTPESVRGDLLNPPVAMPDHR